MVDTIDLGVANKLRKRGARSGTKVPLPSFGLPITLNASKLITRHAP